jgi:hypothetical protein
MKIFKLLVVGFVVLSLNSFAETIVDNNRNMQMYEPYKSQNNVYQKAEKFVYEKMFRSFLDDKYKLYLDNSLGLDDRVKKMKSDWGKTAGVIAEIPGIIAGFDKTKTVSKALIDGATDKLISDTEKMIIRLSVKQMMSELPINQELQTEITDSFSPIIELVTVDFLNAKNFAERKAAALGLFTTTITNSAINIGAWFKSANLQGYYSSYKNLMNFFDEYYKCGTELQCVIDENNLKLPISHKLFSVDSKTYLRMVYYAFTEKIAPTYFLASTTRDDLEFLLFDTIAEIKNIAKSAIDAERKLQRDLRIAKYVSKYALSGKIIYLKQNLVFPKYIELDSNSDYAISKNVKLEDFLNSMKLFEPSIDIMSLDSTKNLTQSELSGFTTIDKVIKILDEFSYKAFDNIKPAYKTFYNLNAISQYKTAGNNNKNKIFFNIFSKNLQIPDYIKRQFINIQGRSLAVNSNDLSTLNSKALNGYKAIKLLFNLKFTLEQYKGDK